MRESNLIAVLEDFGATCDRRPAQIGSWVFNWASRRGTGNAVLATGWKIGPPGDRDYIDCRGTTSTVLLRFLLATCCKQQWAGTWLVAYTPVRTGKGFSRELSVGEFDQWNRRRIADRQALSLAEAWFRGEPAGVLLDWLKEEGHIPMEAA